MFDHSQRSVVVKEPLLGQFGFRTTAGNSLDTPCWLLVSLVADIVNNGKKNRRTFKLAVSIEFWLH